MTAKKTINCDACGKKRKTTKVEDHALCSQCQIIADAVTNQPDLLKKICGMVESPCDAQPETAQELPEVLDARRFRTRDREMNTWYVSVSEHQGQPIEIFASTAFDRDQHLQSRISNLTTITRLISLILRHVVLHEKLTLSDTIQQLQKSSRQKNDLPDMLTRVLRNYEADNSQKANANTE